MSDKPYRVYRGGRRAARLDDEPALRLPDAAENGLDDGPEVAPDPAPTPRRRGPVILPPTAEPGRPGAPREDGGGGGPPARARRRAGPRRLATPREPRPLRWARRRLGRSIVGVRVSLLLLTGIWVAIGYLAFKRSVEAANRRLDPRARPALTPQNGLLLSRATDILVLGADRTGHSDSLQIIHTDPARHLVSTLSIPRDLLVVIPGRNGRHKLNEAFTLGGAGLAARTVQALTSLPVNHLIVVDFGGFRQLIDALGGVDVTSPGRIQSRFDGITYRFPKGRVHLDGRHALAYARVRKNAYNAQDSDVSRGVRQQQVMQALKARLVSPGSLLRLRGVGPGLARPLATDLSANQILSLGWVDFRAQRKVSCNLGGTPSPIAGQLGLQSDSEGNRRVLREFLGETALQVVPKGQPFAPACRRG